MTTALSLAVAALSTVITALMWDRQRHAERRARAAEAAAIRAMDAATVAKDALRQSERRVSEAIVCIHAVTPQEALDVFARVQGDTIRALQHAEELTQ